MEDNDVQTGNERPLTSGQMKFFLAGKAYFTLRSTKTSVRYTYKVTRAKDSQDKPIDLWFVSFLTGPDNYLNYSYIGVIRPDAKSTNAGSPAYQFKLTGKSRLPTDAPPCKAIDYTVSCLQSRPNVPGVEIFHAGRCARCGRMLTVPSSIESGYGPECAGLI